jgi:hypothetical protein
MSDESRYLLLEEGDFRDIGWEFGQEEWRTKLEILQMLADELGSPSSQRNAFRNTRHLGLRLGVLYALDSGTWSGELRNQVTSARGTSSFVRGTEGGGGRSTARLA